MIKFLKRVFRFLMGRPFLVSLFLLIQLLIVGYAIWLLGTSGYTVILIFEILGVFLSLFIRTSSLLLPEVKYIFRAIRV